VGGVSIIESQVMTIPKSHDLFGVVLERLSEHEDIRVIANTKTEKAVAVGVAIFVVVGALIALTR